MRRTYQTITPIRILLLLPFVFAANAAVCLGADSGAEKVVLPTAAKWRTEVADVRGADDVTEVIAPINYKIGRVVSPSVPARAGDAFTIAADVRTEFASSQRGFYRFWLQLECLQDDKVIQTFSSPELVDTQENEQLLAVTAYAPDKTTAVRAVLCAQNKFWAPVDNEATVRDFRMFKLDGDRGQQIELDVLQKLPSDSGERRARLVVRGDWPDGTAVLISSTRGTVTPSVLLSDGRAEMALAYATDEVGRAEVTARIADRESRLQIHDPRAATLSIDRVMADGLETPVLVQLTHQGEMLPGRYQATVAGKFVTPPWQIDLAPGPWQLRISRGPQFKSHEQTLQCVSGEKIALGSLELTRNVDLTRHGWYGGDGDGDVYHGERIYKDVNAETAANIAQAMGLDWLGVGRWGVGELGGPHPETWGEAEAFTESLSHPRFLFMWTDERPKQKEGHACFVGLSRPAEDSFPWGWGWKGSDRRPLRTFEMLQLIRESGGATFANHPLRWWMKGTRFNTNMYSSLPFDLCAAGLLDGVNINDKPEGIELWSMLLDHGYRVAATAGADFCLDRPSGPPPGRHRMYCYCPDGLGRDALAQAIRNGHTIVSTGPVLLADIDGQPPGSTVPTGQPHRIKVQAWAQGDRVSAPLRRLELWAHGRVIESKEFGDGAQKGEATFDWTPEGEQDWVAVRAVARGGWAMTSAFYAAAPDYQPPQPLECRLTLNVSGLDDQELAGASVEVWDGVPSLVTATKLSTAPLRGNETVDAPVSGTVVVHLADDRQQEISIYDATGMPELIAKIASGDERQEPLLEWETYARVLDRAKQATVEVRF